MLYALLISEHFSTLPPVIDGLIALKITPIVAPNTAAAMNILSEYPHLIHILIFNIKVIIKEPFFISQLRMQAQHKHLPIGVLKEDLASENTTSISDGLVMNEITDLSPLIPQLQKNALDAKKAQFDIGTISHAIFHFQNLNQGSLLAQYLSRQYPNSQDILLGIQELFINAIEHGNLEISYENKSSLLASGRWLEEIQERSNQQPFASRYVEVLFKKDNYTIELMVTDQGKGFDWTKYEQFDPKRLLASHGRGIMMAKSLSFSQIEYLEKGNKVRAIYLIPGAP